MADDPRSLESKINLLLALVVEQHSPDGDFQDMQELLLRAGVDIGVPVETQQAVRFIRQFEDRDYFFTRKWVTRRLDAVNSQLESLHERFGRVAATTSELTTALAASTATLQGVDERLKASSEVARDATAESRESRKVMQELAGNYATLRISTSNIEADVQSLKVSIKSTTEALEEVNKTLVNLQRDLKP